MGQYHLLVNMNTREHLSPYEIGCGLKAWEQAGGGVPAALTFLLAGDAGNMPADLGHHPMVGRWAGHRLLVVGDYAERGDLRKFDGPPLNRIYSLCGAPPTLEDFEDREYWQVPGETTEYGISYYARPWNAKRRVETANKQYRSSMAGWRKLTVNGKYEPFANVTPKLVGALEFALSERFYGKRWRNSVAVQSRATRGTDGHLHYRIADRIRRDADTWRYICRTIGLGGSHDSPPVNPNAEFQPNGERWPWDRPPADLSWHNATDADASLGQQRVFVNLDRAEYFDPAGFGETATTLGIMRAANSQPSKRRKLQFSSAGALWAMLLHPERRGGGDIDIEDFPLLGRWRNCQIALTSERGSNNVLPTTEEVQENYENITAEVVRAAREKKQLAAE